MRHAKCVRHGGGECKQNSLAKLSDIAHPGEPCRHRSCRAKVPPHTGILRGVSVPLNFHLEQYDGPLDLLLDLIRKQQVNIYDIPIASITQQYLEYMQRALELDIELSAEFVYMAATLIHIKSRMLLPKDPELDKISPEEDPRQELVDRLLEHERFKNAAEMLQQKKMIEEAVWSNPQIDQFLAEDNDPGLSVTLFDLVKTLQVVLERAKNRPSLRSRKRRRQHPGHDPLPGSHLSRPQQERYLVGGGVVRKAGKPARHAVPVPGGPGTGPASGVGADPERCVRRHRPEKEPRLRRSARSRRIAGRN